MVKKGEESMAKFSGGAGKGRSQNDSRSQAPVIHANRVLRSDSLRGSGLVIADSLDSKKKKKKEEEKRKKK